MSLEALTLAAVPFLLSQVTPESAISDYLAGMGVFAVAVVIAWWLLGRSDRQLEAERNSSREGLKRLEHQLELEQAAHEETRKRLFEALERKDP